MSRTLPKSRIASALFPGTRRALLALFFGNPERRYYLSEVVRVSGVGTGSVQRELLRMIQAGLLIRTREGRMQYFQANRSGIVFHELSSLVAKTIGLVPILVQALSPLKDRIRRAFIFGSIANASETDRSDIDLMVIGEASIREIVTHLNVAQDQLGREINPSVLSEAEYQDRIAKKDGFLQRVLASPKLALLGGEDDAA